MASTEQDCDYDRSDSSLRPVTQSSNKMKRRPKFTDNELQALVDGVEHYKNIIEGMLSSKLSNNDKSKAWEAVTASVNSVGSWNRTIPEVRRKYIDYKCATKKKGCDVKKSRVKTGGGHPPKLLNELEEKMLGVIGPLNLNGEPGGLDIGYKVSKDNIDQTTSHDAGSKFEGFVELDSKFDVDHFGLHNEGPQLVYIINDSPILSKEEKENQNPVKQIPAEQPVNKSYVSGSDNSEVAQDSAKAIIDIQKEIASGVTKLVQLHEGMLQLQQKQYNLIQDLQTEFLNILKDVVGKQIKH